MNTTMVNILVSAELGLLQLVLALPWMIAVLLNHDGRVLETEVVESSGSKTLDRRAQAIARGAAPFGPFNAAMRRRADQIVVVSRFKFTRDDTLETRLTSR